MANDPNVENGSSITFNNCCVASYPIRLASRKRVTRLGPNVQSLMMSDLGNRVRPHQRDV